MSFKVVLTKTAAKELSALDAPVRVRVVQRIARLADSPHDPGSRMLLGDLDGYRVRVGDWRILYAVNEAAMLVTVYAVRHRREAYR